MRTGFFGLAESRLHSQGEQQPQVPPPQGANIVTGCAPLLSLTEDQSFQTGQELLPLTSACKGFAPQGILWAGGRHLAAPFTAPLTVSTKASHP